MYEKAPVTINIKMSLESYVPLNFCKVPIIPAPPLIPTPSRSVPLSDS